MLCRVFVLRVVTASDVSAMEAAAEVHPDVARPQAFLAAVGFCGSVVGQAEMIAGQCGLVSDDPSSCGISALVANRRLRSFSHADETVRPVVMAAAAA